MCVETSFIRYKLFPATERLHFSVCIRTTPKEKWQHYVTFFQQVTSIVSKALQNILCDFERASMNEIDEFVPNVEI